MRFPDFLGIGAQKAGTTWLHRNLSGHPDVWLPPVKELHYFDQLYVDTPGHQQAADERRRERARQLLARDPANGAGDSGAAELIASGVPSDAWYGFVFAFAPPASACGEITPAYALLPPAGVDHIARLMPDVKILFLLRDPIDRAWAHVQMLYRRGSPHRQRQFHPSPTLEVDPRVLARSRYSATLRVYRARFEERSIWIGDFDRLATDPEGLLRSVCAFLDVEFDPRLFPDLHRKVHVGRPRGMDEAAYARLRAALEDEYDELDEILPDAARRWRARHFG